LLKAAARRAILHITLYRIMGADCGLRVFF
jgi:hypothetical protein